MADFPRDILSRLGLQGLKGIERDKTQPPLMVSGRATSSQVQGSLEYP